MPLGSRIPLAVLATAIVAFSCAPAAVAVPMPPITTVAGPAGLSDPVGIEALSNGHVLVVDDGDHVVRDFDGSGLTLVAGTPGQNFDGADGTAASALHDPSAVTSVPSGGFYVADTGSNRIRKFSGNTSTTVAGANPVNPVVTTIASPRGVATFQSFYGNDFAYTEDGASAGQGKVTLIGATGTTPVVAPVATSENAPRGIAIDPADGFLWAESGAGAIHHNSYSLDDYTTPAGGGGSSADGVPATQESLQDPVDVAIGNQAAVAGPYSFVIAEKGRNRVREVTAAGTIITVAGGDSSGSSGDGGPADQALLFAPSSVSVSAEGLFIDDESNQRIRKVDADWIQAGPSGSLSSKTADFSFISWDQDARFRCALDGVVSNCTSPQHLTGLLDGQHTFSVAYEDAFGNVDPTPATRTWTVDTMPPSAPVLQDPADGATGQPLKPQFTWQTDPDVASYIVEVDGADWDGHELSEGLHHWRVRATDAAGNSTESAERSVSVGVAPVAAIVAAPNPVLAGRRVTFDGSASTDQGSGIKRYEWDLDGDGTFETDTGTTPTASATFATPRTLTARLRVTDGVGLTSEADTVLKVTSTPAPGKPIGVSVNDGAQYTNDPNVTIVSVWPSFATDMLVSNDGGFGKGAMFPVTAKLPWKLDSSGPERLPKTVYVRFSAGLQTSETFTDDIILDQTPPTVVSAEVRPATTAAAAARTLRLRARDNVSGVGAVQIALGKRKPGRFRHYRTRIRIAGSGRVRVRVRDRAGNLSRWKAVRKG